MPIRLEASGFYEWHDRYDRIPMLGVCTARLDECLAFYHRATFTGLLGHPSFGFEQDNFDFLSRVPDVAHLWFWDIALQDIEGIYALQSLESVGVHPKRPGIDFARFPKLRAAVVHWTKADRGIVESTITDYSHWHFKPRTKSYESLEIPRNVEKLEFCWANPPSLAGLPVLRKLKEFQFHRCRNLTDLSALPVVAPNLRKLLITTSSRVDPSAGILDHPKLKMALIDGKHLISESD